MGIVAGAVMAGISVVGSLKKSQGDKAQAKADAAAQKQAWKQRVVDTRENYKQVALAEQQANQEYREDLMQNQISLAQQQAEVELMAAASGTGGQSISAMLTDLSTSAGQNQSKIVQNFENEQTSLSNQYRSIQSGASMEMRQFKKPTTGETVMGATSAGLQGFMGGYNTGTALKGAYTDYRKGSTIKTN
ncbi:internal virion protein [Lelliottia phage phD2B]|uniref:Putative internal virion protein n=1 Tax=Lelliottia phage phD2B TaxID=1542498 RepID=A0A088FSC5_9CAUD|nr:internal virion protein [Lelliottia phage phD2B]AIM51261.1 putative internal virion protein [Lelliottia phage phD2B]